MSDEKQYTDLEVFAAHIEAFCQLLALSLAHTQGLGVLLGQKGLINAKELQNSREQIPPVVYKNLVTQVRGQMEQRVREILQQSSGEGKIH